MVTTYSRDLYSIAEHVKCKQAFECEFVWVLCVFIVGCSHQRSWEYFIESIQRPNAFLADSCVPGANSSIVSCDTSIQAYMGIDADERYTYSRPMCDFTTNTTILYMHKMTTQTRVKIFKRTK